MDKSRNEEDSGQITQHLDSIQKFLEDEDAFEHMFFPDRSRNEEDHNFSGQQQLELKKFLEDEDAFEHMFFPPTSMEDYNPNEYTDLNDQHELLNKEINVNEGGGFVESHHGSNMQVEEANNGDQSMNVKLTDGKNVTNKRKTGKRGRKPSKESARLMELKKIKNRETATRAYERKKAYIEELELEVQKFCKKNEYLRKLLLFEESSISSMGLDMTRKQLKRTASTIW